MVKLGAFLGYSFSSLGIGLFVITSFFIFASAKYPGASDVIYPYRALAGPSLVTGLLFLNFGIFSIWIDYTRAKRKQEALLKHRLEEIEKNKKIVD